MKVFFICLLAVATCHCKAMGSSDFTIDKEAEHLIENLSDKAKFNHSVWVEGAWEEISQKWIKEELVGGVLLTEPANAFTHPKHVSVALKLDHRLTLQSDNSLFPTVKTLANISDFTLRESYYRWFKQQAINRGYDFLILEKKSEAQPGLSVYNELIAFDSTFFLSDDWLKRSPDTRRKKFYQPLNHHLAQVINASAFDEFKKILSKGPRKAQYDELVLDLQIQQLLKNRSVLAISQKQQQALLNKLWKKSIVPIQNKEGVLPLLSDTIGIWSSSQLFVDQMDLYFNTVLNARFDEISKNTPVIIDGRENQISAVEKAMELAEHPIIWIGEITPLFGIKPIAILYTPGNHESLDHVIPEMIYGSEPIQGQFNQLIPEYLAGYQFEPVFQQQLLGFSQPEWLNMDRSYLDSVDRLAEEMIKTYATPGGQVLIAKEGKIVFEKNYGYLTYDSLIRVQPHTVYDLASLTKVTATLMATMKLNQEERLSLDSTLGYYLPEFRETDKSKITIRQLLAHQSGLKSYLPFWKRSLRGDFVDIFYYKSEEDAQNDNRSYGYQPDPIMLDSLMGWIQHTPLIAEEKIPYRYSDIGFMILHQVIEAVTGQTMDVYLEENFYQPLGMYSTCFNPMNKGYELYEIAPTEYDYYFRDEQVWGQVHDRNAAIFGGVAGHAGLFSNAKDLALLMQMIMQDGNYRNQQFLSPYVLDRFNQQYFTNNRRGLGWDKPGNYNPNISSASSDRSFGHTGFTGTMVWVDPEEELIFIFLSNRIFPDANNRKLIELDTRKRMHDLVYQSISAP